MAYTQYGKKVIWNDVSLDGVLIQSIELTETWDTKEIQHLNGDVHSVTKYNQRAEFSGTVYFLEGTTATDVQTNIGAWLATQAKSEFDMDDGGASVFPTFKVKMEVADGKSADVSGTYYPNAKE
ncbi:MAG: hypothetical protein LUD39_04085 [Opitutae bacterium]|nr:hypothetical protein [Opitutae bacterium]MCD8298921.1 hypothetical protein [Opitutae bacterium]